MRNVFDTEKKLLYIECCHSEDKKLKCEQNIPFDAEYLFGLYPGRFSEAIKDKNLENLIEQTVPDK
ncbi:MAG: hypothetical protein ABFD50_21825 [Smithella sp.]